MGKKLTKIALKAFLSDLQALTDKHRIAITGVSCGDYNIMLGAAIPGHSYGLGRCWGMSQGPALDYDATVENHSPSPSRPSTN